MKPYTYPCQPSGGEYHGAPLAGDRLDGEVLG